MKKKFKPLRAENEIETRKRSDRGAMWCDPLLYPTNRLVPLAFAFALRKSAVRAFLLPLGDLSLAKSSTSHIVRKRRRDLAFSHWHSIQISAFTLFFYFFTRFHRDSCARVIVDLVVQNLRRYSQLYLLVPNANYRTQAAVVSCQYVVIGNGMVVYGTQRRH